MFCHPEQLRRRLRSKSKRLLSGRRHMSATLRAEHGIARGFAPLSKPIPEDLLTITDMKEQKWTAMVYWSDVLDKNFIGHVKAVPEDALAGKRAHSFPKHMFEHMKNTWLELTEVDQLTAGENRAAQIQAKKDLKAQQQRIKAEQRQKREELALWNASFHDEEDHVDYEPSDNEQDGGVGDDSEMRSLMAQKVTHLHYQEGALTEVKKSFS